MENRKIQQIAQSICEQNGFILVDFETKGSHRNPVFSVYADNETCITLKQCEQLSRKLQDEIDILDDAPVNYRLNVSSPGLDRPLKFDFQFRKNIGRELNIEFKDDQGKQKVTGKLMAVDRPAIKLEKKDGRVKVIKRDDILQAKVKLNW